MVREANDTEYNVFDTSVVFHLVCNFYQCSFSKKFLASLFLGVFLSRRVHANVESEPMMELAPWEGALPATVASNLPFKG